MADKIHARPGLETELLVTRAGKEMKISLVPKNEGGIGLIGVRPAIPKLDHKKITLFSSIKKSGWQCWNISAGTVYYLYHAIRYHVKPDLAGPLGITQVIAKTAKQGMEDLMYLLAMISVAIGLFNLFPIPLLDGGHILYYLIEGVRGKPVSQKVIGKVNMVGMAILLGLMVLATFNDVQRLKSSPASATPAPSPAAQK
jgi:regulator of sigma E protease